MTILRKIWPYLLLGVGPGVGIYGWVPRDFFTSNAGPGNDFGVLVAVVLGIPLYSNVAGIAPLLHALHEEGLPSARLILTFEEPRTIIKVLDSGCADCITLERLTREAVDALGLDATIGGRYCIPRLRAHGNRQAGGSSVGLQVHCWLGSM